MEERISGFKLRGTWEEIVEHGERITEALEDLGDAFAMFDDLFPGAAEFESRDAFFHC